MQTQQEQHPLTWTRRQIVIIVIIVLIVAVAVGNFITTTTEVQSTSSGSLTISENATCVGFGEPVYWNSIDQDNNFTSYQYGRCLFGFWVSNGQAIGSAQESGSALVVSP